LIPTVPILRAMRPFEATKAMAIVTTTREKAISLGSNVIVAAVAVVGGDFPGIGGCCKGEDKREESSGREIHFRHDSAEVNG
jgi:hypothetical protein